MGDTKGSALTQITTIADSDGIYVVDGLGGTPSSKIITKVNFDKGKAVQAATYAAMRALTIAVSVIVKGRLSDGDGGGGVFYWDSTDLSTEVTADTQSGIYVAPDSDATGASGAWVRLYNGHVEVAWFGAFAGSDKGTEIQAAMDSGAPAVLFADGEYWANGLTLNDNQKLYADSLGGVTIKALDGASTAILANADAAVPTERLKVEFKNIIFDGNKANADAGAAAASAVTVNGVIGLRVINCIFRNAAGYGLGMQSYAGSSLEGDQKNIYIEDTQFNTNGDGTAFDSATFDGFDIKDCDGLTMIGCSATGNADKGIDVRGDNVSIVGGFSTGNIKGYGFSGNAAGEDLATNMTVTGVSSYSNTGDGIELGSGTATPLGTVRVNLVGVHSYSNALRGINMAAESEDMQVSVVSANLHDNTEHGFQALENTDSVVLSNCSIKSNGIDGISTDIVGMKIDNCDIQLNVSRGVHEQTNGSGTIISDSTIINNTVGDVLMNSTTKTMQATNSFDLAPGNQDIASSATLQIPILNETFNVTGTTNISNLANERESRVVRLRFAGVLDVVHGSGIKLNSGSNLTTDANTTLILESDGTDWWQM